MIHALLAEPTLRATIFEPAAAELRRGADVAGAHPRAWNAIGPVLAQGWARAGPPAAHQPRSGPPARDVGEQPDLLAACGIPAPSATQVLDDGGKRCRAAIGEIWCAPRRLGYWRAPR
jgi:hypothetical protein